MNDNSPEQGGLGPRGREILFQPTTGIDAGGSTLVQVADDGVPVTTSLIVAEQTGNQHKNILALVRENLADLNDVGRVAFETRVAGQKALVAEFYAMREMLVGNTQSMTLAEQCLFHAQALVDQERRLGAIEHDQARLAQRVDAIMPATRKHLQHLGTVAGRIGRSEGLTADRIPDGRDGAVNGWPLWVWDRAYTEVSA